MRQALTGYFLSAPAPEHPFSSTRSGILTFSSSIKLGLTEFTRDQWLISHEALLLPRFMELDDKQPAREAWRGAAFGGIKAPCCHRQASLPL